MIFAAGWYPKILPGGNFVDGKKQQVFRRKPAVNVDRKENQRLENWGARRAAFRPYSAGMRSDFHCGTTVFHISDDR